MVVLLTMIFFKTKAEKLYGHTYKDISNQAKAIYKREKIRTKRKPYVRSAYFKKDKIFLELFWQHLWQKNWRDRKRRVQFFDCALDLLRHSRVDSVSVQDPNHKSVMLHRFYGMTPTGYEFCVQVKQDKKTGQKWLMSVFPI